MVSPGLQASNNGLGDRDWEGILRHCETDTRWRLLQMGFPTEVVEEALAATVSKLVQVELRPDSLFGLIWRTAYRCAIDEVRKRNSRLEVALELPNGDNEGREFVSSAPDTERQTIVSIDLHRCLQQLPAVELAIVLHKHLGQSSQKISELLGIESAASVDTRYSNARAQLRQCLGSRERSQAAATSRRRT